MPKKSSKKEKGKAKAPRAPRPAAAPRPAGPAVQLSKCSADYAKSLMEPWGPEAPCLPSGFPLPSLKRKFFARGTAGQGTSTGFILFNPASGVSVTNNSVYFSDGAYTGTTAVTIATGVTAAPLNSTYTNGLFGPIGLQYRTVSAGLRVRYTGTELNRGGRIIPFEHPQHNTAAGMTVQQLLSMQGVQPVRPSSDGKWITIVSSGPKEEFELGYSADWTLAFPYLVVMMNGGVGPTGIVANFTIEWEAWANYELIGVGLSGQTASHHDPIGASLAASAVTAAQNTHPHSASPGFSQDVMKGIETMGKEAVTTVWNNRGAIWDVAKTAAAFL